jgi:hypothetical protein
MARVAVERMSGSIFDTRHYRESQLTRLVNLFAHVDIDAWRGMRMLEVGSGLGYLGDVFETLGFDVTSTDGRPEYVELMQARGRKSFALDLDRTLVSEVGEFDLVLAFGVLYHLARPAEFLAGCSKARVLLLETAVCDRAVPVVEWVDEAGGWRGKDQALRGRGCRPSPAWVEHQCRQAGFEPRDISTRLANYEIGCYDWQPTDAGGWRRDGVNLRKMWVCGR